MATGLDEFALIQRYFSGGKFAPGAFSRKDSTRADAMGEDTAGTGAAEMGAEYQGADCKITGNGVVLGIGDDCAILQPGSDELVVSTDTLVAGVHFPEQSAAAEIAQKALRVNLSDIAAMGGRPKWFLLALTLPEADESWLADFARGLHQVADAFQCALVGGDTSRGPLLTITITVLGSASPGRALRRSGARPGDRIYVTGSLGDAAAGLAIAQGTIDTATNDTDHKYLTERFWRPAPRIAEGQLLQAYASAAIDISDGLLADLGHIVTASGVGAAIDVVTLPLSRSLNAVASPEQALRWALTGGDDYELCFTVPPERCADFEAAIAAATMDATAIGVIVPGSAVVCHDAEGHVLDVATAGYRHF